MSSTIRSRIAELDAILKTAGEDGSLVLPEVVAAFTERSDLVTELQISQMPRQAGGKIARTITALSCVAMACALVYIASVLYDFQRRGVEVRADGIIPVEVLGVSGASVEVDSALSPVRVEILK